MATVFMYFLVAFFMILLVSFSILNLWIRSESKDIIYDSKSNISLGFLPI